MTAHRLQSTKSLRSFLSSKYRLEIIAAILLVLASLLLMYMGANKILDTKLYYSQEDALALFSLLDTAGIENYKLIALIDLFVYIPAYTWLLLLLAKRFLPDKYWFRVFVPAAFDVVETSTIYLYLSGYIATFPAWTGYFTSLKWISGTVIVLAIGANIFKKNPRLQ